MLVITGIAVLTLGFYNATRDPIIRTANVQAPNWPAGAPPFRVLLISDVHVAGPDMTPARLSKIIHSLNALKPDMVAIAGDLISEKRVATSLYSPAKIAAVLAQLKSPQGSVVVLGNHDNWADAGAFRRELSARGITVLENEATVRGPMIIGGVGDHFSRHDDVPATYAAMDGLGDKLGNAPRIILTHSPDIVPALPAPVAAVLAGHTHCGQIALPFYGAVSYVSDYGARFACGDINDKGANGVIQRVFVAAGLGTSIIPLRYGAPPDVWVVTFGPDK